MKTMKNKKNKKNKSQKAQQSFTERIAKAAGGFKERAKSMNSEEKAEQVQQPEQPETQQAQPEGGETEVDVKALQAELEKAKAQSDEYLDLAQRKQAEFANYRRRTEGIRAEAFDDGRREAISQLLPIVDNLERKRRRHGKDGLCRDLPLQFINLPIRQLQLPKMSSLIKSATEHIIGLQHQ